MCLISWRKVLSELPLPQFAPRLTKIHNNDFTATVRQLSFLHIPTTAILYNLPQLAATALISAIRNFTSFTASRDISKCTGIDKVGPNGRRRSPRALGACDWTASLPMEPYSDVITNENNQNSSQADLPRLQSRNRIIPSDRLYHSELQQSMPAVLRNNYVIPHPSFSNQEPEGSWWPPLHRGGQATGSTSAYHL